MATTSSYIPGMADPEAAQANQAYQEALNKMLASLDARKNRLFDPTLLAFSQAMLTPGQTGSFGEAIGRAAGAVRESELQQAKEEQDLARMRLELAGMGMNLQQQKARERAFQTAMGGTPTVPGGAPAVPGGEPQAPGVAGRAPGIAPPGFEGVPGIQIAPPDTSFLGRRRYLAAAMTDPSKTLPAALKEAEELERSRYQTKEGGVLDISTGMFYQFPKTEAVERQIGGKTYKIPAQSAALLDFYQSTNDPRYATLAANVTQTGVGGPMKSESEKEIEKASEIERAKTLATKMAEKEASSESRASSARQMLFNANRVQQLVSSSPQAVGIFSRPTLVASLGTIISKGVQTPGGTLNLAGFEDAVRQAMPGVKQRDIDNVTMAAGALAEIELAYTVLYMQKQGAITEGEREVVRRIGGNLSQSPGALLQKAKLVQMRSQHDINVHEAWRDFQRSNPRGNFDQFERSDEYRSLQRSYDQSLAGAFNVTPPRSPGRVTPSDFRVRPVGEQ